MNTLDSFLRIVFRWAMLTMFALSMWAMAFNTVGYAMYFILVAIFLHLESAYHEKKEQVQA